MSKVTKRKHLVNEVLDDFSLPARNQQIVQVVRIGGNNLHEVKTPDGSSFLVSMPVKFRKIIWLKRNDYILVENIPEGVKVKAEMVRPLSLEHIKYFKQQGVWPYESDCEKVTPDESEIFVNTNRIRNQNSKNTDSTDSDSSSSGSSSSDNN